MNRIRAFIAVLITIILQVSIFSRIEVFGVSPNLAIPVITALSIGFGSFSGGYSGLAMGLVEDILFSKVIGFRALIYFVMGFMIGNNEYRLNIKENKTGMIITAISTFAFYLVFLAVQLFIGNTKLINYLKGPIFLEIFMNIIIYYLVMKIFRKIFIFPNVRYY
ncbi:MAG: rod shape-determining protein MreD [Tissierellia bacterium]|nr:rod shape-determining protein MreD [Tissierellia bacterium]